MSVGTRGGGGLTLIEVVVAVALLGVTVVVAGSVFAQASRLRVTAQRHDGARIAVDNEIERLRALPFWTGSDGAAQQDGSLVRTVFPHAVTGRNTESCYFVAGGGGDAPPGAFVTSRASGDVVLRVIARFAVATSEGWCMLEGDDIQGYSCDEAWRPPAATMLVAVAALAVAGGDSSVLYEQYALVGLQEAAGERAR